jgi:hypothetical protein
MGLGLATMASPTPVLRRLGMFPGCSKLLRTLLPHALLFLHTLIPATAQTLTPSPWPVRAALAASRASAKASRATTTATAASDCTRPAPACAIRHLKRDLARPLPCALPASFAPPTHRRTAASPRTRIFADTLPTGHSTSQATAIYSSHIGYQIRFYGGNAGLTTCGSDASSVSPPGGFWTQGDGSTIGKVEVDGSDIKMYVGGTLIRTCPGGASNTMHAHVVLYENDAEFTVASLSDISWYITAGWSAPSCNSVCTGLGKTCDAASIHSATLESDCATQHAVLSSHGYPQATSSCVQCSPTDSTNAYCFPGLAGGSSVYYHTSFAVGGFNCDTVPDSRTNPSICPCR